MSNMKSRIVKGVLEDELRRNEKVILRYEKEIENFPKGCLFIRHIGNNQYGYFNIRIGNTVKSKYIGILSNDKIKSIKSDIKKRNEYKKIINNIKKENIEIMKILNRS